MLHSRKCIWKYLLRSGGHFAQGRWVKAWVSNYILLLTVGCNHSSVPKFNGGSAKAAWKWGHLLWMTSWYLCGPINYVRRHWNLSVTMIQNSRFSVEGTHIGTSIWYASFWDPHLRSPYFLGFTSLNCLAVSCCRLITARMSLWHANFLGNHTFFKWYNFNDSKQNSCHQQRLPTHVSPPQTTTKCYRCMASSSLLVVNLVRAPLI